MALSSNSSSAFNVQPHNRLDLLNRQEMLFESKSVALMS